jgi:EmrB/QacA subfamily drug resistance transporter
MSTSQSSRVSQATQASVPSGLKATNPLPPRSRSAVTVGIMMGLFLAAIEQTVVATAMPTVVASLGGLNIYSWVFSAYLLAFTISVPIWGRLSDIYGRRNLYLVSIGLFILGSALCGQARSMSFLIVSRALQGLGGGGVFPIGFTIVGEIYSLEQRARIQGLFSGVWGLASITGPLAGGLITDLLSWRWVFYVNIPFGLAAVALIGSYLSEPPHIEARRSSIDYRGAAALAASLTSLLLALIQMGKRGSMVEPDLLALLGASVVLFTVFLRLERRAEEPLLPISLFKNRVFWVCSGIGFLAGMGLFGSISFIPLFVQGVIFGSATRAGSALTPLMLAWVFFSIASGRLILRFGYRPVVIAGMVFFAAGFLGLLRLGNESAYGDLLPSMAILGVGMGLSMVAVLLAVQSTVPRSLLGTATSAQLFFRTIGGAVGVAIMGSVMGHRMIANLKGTTDPTFVARLPARCLPHRDDHRRRRRGALARFPGRFARGPCFPAVGLTHTRCRGLAPNRRANMRGDEGRVSPFG